jgi:flavin reductase (DIM6/NTAB) family NADH-FMN oxidoreductase RutF
MIIDPENNDPRNIYRLMTGSVVPRTIAFVSTVSPEGVRNLAPFSFFTGVCANPPVICFSPMVRGRDGTTKDTLRNIIATQEFVVNVVSEELAKPMNACSADFPPEVDEFAESGLTAISCERVKPPRVKESPISMECRLLQIVHVSTKPLGGSLVLGEIIRFHLRDDLVENFSVNPELLRAIGRMGGTTYSRTSDRFELRRPNWPPGPSPT